MIAEIRLAKLPAGFCFFSSEWIRINGGNLVRGRFFLAAVFFSITVYSCSKSDNAFPENPLVVVGGHKVYGGDFEEYYIKHLISTGRNDTRQARYHFLDEFIGQLILADEAFKVGVENEKEYARFVDLQTKKALRDFYYLFEMEKKHVQQTDEELRTAYQKSKSKRYVRQLYFRDLATAERYHERLKSGESFIKLANILYQTTSFDSTAGMLGEVGYFSTDDAVAEVVFSLPVDSISPIVQSRWGLHILRVEHIIQEPLLSEEQYQTAKKGIGSQLKLRKQRLQGNDFVKAFMTETSPVFNEPLMKKMAVHLKEFHQEKTLKAEPASQPDMIRFEERDLPAILVGYQPNEVLATYSVGGRSHQMTVSDFASWLPDLLPSEVTNRFGASVGRALRNEALARQAVSEGLNENVRLKHDLELRKSFFAADWFFSKAVATLDTDSLAIDSTVLAAYLQKQAQFEWKVDYLYKTFPTIGEAIQEKSILQSKKIGDLKKAGFRRVEKAEQQGDPFFKMIQDVPLETLSAGLNLNEQPALIYVVKRVGASRLDNESLYKKMFLKKAAADKYLAQLKKNVSIKVDTAAFDALYTLHP